MFLSDLVEYDLLLNCSLPLVQANFRLCLKLEDGLRCSAITCIFKEFSLSCQP